MTDRETQEAAEHYVFTLRAAKAAFKLYASAPSEETFVQACDAVNHHQNARRAFLRSKPLRTPPDT